MSSLSLPSLPAVKVPTVKAGTAARVLGSVVIAGALIVNAPHAAARVLDGEMTTYTVVLKPDANTNAAIASIKDQGATVTGFDTTSDAATLTISVREDKASAIKKDPSVAYLQTDNEQKAQRSWWESVQDKFHV